MYKACIISTLLYGSESWTTYSTQQRKLQVFHLQCLRRILGITWQDKVRNNDVLSRAGIPSMFTLLRQRRLRWLGHVHWMDDGLIPKDVLYGELATGARRKGRPQLRFTDVCKRDLKACNTDTKSWESLAHNRNLWKQKVSLGLKSGEATIRDENDERCARKKACHQQDHSEPQPASLFICQGCSRDCKSRIGLYSHTRRCTSTNPHGSIP